jgi:hypothetical protein
MKDAKKQPLDMNINGTVVSIIVERASAGWRVTMRKVCAQQLVAPTR